MTNECWCCGTTFAAEELIRLGCHEEAAVCDGCVGWLADRRRGRLVRRAVPILATSDVDRALEHYGALGFETEQWEGGDYGFLSRDGVEVHVAAPDGFDPAANTVAWYIFVADADALYEEWKAAGVAGELIAPTDTDYGLREGRHVDPDGNVLRFGSALVGSQRSTGGSVLLAPDDPLARESTAAIRTGDVDGLVRLLRERPELASARIGSADESRTLLHVATDWPGHFPKVPAVIATLAAAGADVDARFSGAHGETPLHWAASSDDVDAIGALLDAGADLEASGAVLGGGSPLADAVGFGQWNAARLLVERGATTRLKDAAALGLMDRVEAGFEGRSEPAPEEVTGALWAACHGGQRRAAEYLLARGADVNWVGWGEQTALDVAVQEGHDDLVDWLRANGAEAAGGPPEVAP
jgi:uncharacterized protein